MAFRYCVARINGDREAARPTVFQLRTCLAEVGDHIDAEAYQALNILALSIDSRAKNFRQSPEHNTDFFGLDGEPMTNAEYVDPTGANDYGVFGEPPEARFANSSQPEARLELKPSRTERPLAQRVEPRQDVRQLASRPLETRASAARAPAPRSPTSVRPPDVRRSEPRLPNMRDPVDSLQDARDAHELRAAEDNPPSLIEQMGRDLRALLRTKRTERTG